jgi:HK97 family phage prohead protease
VNPGARCRLPEPPAYDPVTAGYDPPAPPETTTKGHREGRKATGDIVEQHQFKTFTATIKSADQGIVTALVSTWGIDMEQERVQPGAFASSIRRMEVEGRTLPVLREHDWKGAVLGFAKPQDMAETMDGLVIVAQFDMASEPGRAAFTAIKNKSLSEWSIGMVNVKSEMVNGIRVLLDMDLVEASVVLRGMNPGTTTIATKGIWPDSEQRAKAIIAPVAERKDIGMLRWLAGRSTVEGRTVFDTDDFRQLGDHLLQAAAEAMGLLEGLSPVLPAPTPKSLAFERLTLAARDMEMPDDLIQETMRRIAVAKADKAEEVVTKAIADAQALIDARQAAGRRNLSAQLAARRANSLEAMEKGRGRPIGLSPNMTPIYADNNEDNNAERKAEERAITTARSNEAARMERMAKLARLQEQQPRKVIRPDYTVGEEKGGQG